MMKILRIVLLMTLLLVTGVTAAKGPSNRITITGPGLTEPIEITDTNILIPLSFVTFENNFENVPKAPTNLGEGYELTRYCADERGNYMAFDHEHYFPDPRGGRGYVFYDGIINGSSTYDGRWFRVNVDSEKVLQSVLQHVVVSPTTTPEPIPSIELKGHTADLTVLAWSPDSQRLATSAGWADSQVNTVRLWKTDGTLVATLDEQTAPVVNMAWSPDGQTLATGSWDNTVQLWDANGTLLGTLKTSGAALGLSWSPDGQILAVGSLIATNDNRVELWQPDGTLLKTFHTRYSGGKFLNVAWSPDGKYLVGGAIDYTEWMADGTSVFSHDSCEHCTPAWGFAWSPDSQMWAMGDENGTVWVYSVAGELVSDLQNNGNVDVLAWSPDGKILAGGNSLWQFNGKTFDYRATVSSGRVASLAWSPDSSMIASTFGATYVRMTDTDGHLLAALDGHTNRVQVLAWSPDGKILASGSVDHTVRLWDMTKLHVQ
jgi:WD40 repeat protein